MNILLDFRPFLNEIPSNGQYFCEDFCHALFRNNSSDVFYIWTTGGEHLPAQYKFDQYSNVRRIHTNIEIDRLYTLIRFFGYPAIDDLVETLAMKNGHMAWVGKFDVAFFATPMPVLLEGDCLHVQITNHLKPLHTPDIFLEDHMKYQEKKWYKKNWSNADINVVPSEFLANELRKEIDEDDNPIFLSNVGITQNIIRFVPNEDVNIKEEEIDDIIEMNDLYNERSYQQKKYDELPTHFFYSKETLETIENTLKAFSLFRGRYSHSIVELIIEEPFKDAFKFTNFLSRNNYIKIIPPVLSNDKIIILSKCIAFIQPDIYNTEGISLLEAMKCGAPIICSSFGVFPEICPPSNYFFDPMSYNELFRGMKHMYNLHKFHIEEEDNSEYNILSQENIKIASENKYSWDDITLNLMRNIQDILEEKEFGM
ncbi:TPA: glycosyltransferase [Candidatus Peregrinibacteria bacterium]|nr:glycosyltransferase [Candidatus Peregrinibacteria bacterium]HIQ57337.1 glycosyltransferase [Candidatus Gracilibacteria bacterium]